MHTKSYKGWLKHGDFILIDLLCMQFCFTLGYWVNNGLVNPYGIETIQYQSVILLVCQLLVVLFSNNYTGIIRRGSLAELVATIRYMVSILFLTLLYLFAMHQSSIASRLHLAMTSVFFVLFSLGLREINKLRIRKTSSNSQRRAFVLITSAQYVPEVIENLSINPNSDIFFSNILLLDKNNTLGDKYREIPVSILSADAIHQISHEWVDEVFILQPQEMAFPPELADALIAMGIPINYTMSALLDDRLSVTEVNKIGAYKVLTSSIRVATPGQAIVKRTMDIVGGLVGSVFTVLLTLIIGPLIYIKSPGPIFFKQERVGKNGKTFKMYKFRSMYMDAEQRKAELMEHNQIKSSLMFKMSDDPRIIGSEKKGKNGEPKGIGNFIRNTSLDEFPQFFNILKGDMSLVGTRPPTLDEWVQYDLEHRIRMSIKPGLTGMWQVSGRSEITDFEEVVRLDREYIEKWNLLLDIKIMLKTILVVLGRKGAR